ncbi:MAG: PQQ-binding-like beta-propeller repeat protein [Planctomycetota bacterium]|nr:PQQ-binding-like beta-propeller repeat protein [Planctomycetota bacterium]
MSRVGLHRRRLLRALCLGLLLLLATAPRAAAEDPLSPEEVRKRSLPLRTALHHDPTLGSPLERLVELYRKADRVEELVAVYRSHLQSYPQDLSARTVYTRLLLATNDPEGPREVRAAVERHPKNGYLHHLLYTLLDDAGDARALEALDKAVSLETLPTRKRRWIEQLLTQALQEDRRDLAGKHLGALAELMGGGAEAHLGAARKMQEFGFHERALKELVTAREARPSPEHGVEIELLASSLEVALGKRIEAARRLDELLARLTADYWRRSEILRRRARLVSSAEERDRMLADARTRSDERPQDESAALDHARLLSGFERHREALEVLRQAGKRLPASAQLEREILATFDRLRDERGRAAYLEQRLEAFPERQDLVERRVRSLFMLGRKEKAKEVLDGLLAKLQDGVRVQRLLETARFLRGRGLPTTAADLYARVVDIVPARLDIRREWAECHLAVGDRTGARRVLAAPIPAETPKDVFLDLIQLLMQQWLYPEARKALNERMQTQGDDLDVHLALIEVEGSLGYGTSGARWVDAARPLADTPARYRRWLEQAVDFHIFYDSEVAFLEAEQGRIEAEAGEWSPTRVGRLEVFAELSADNDRVEPVAGLLQNHLSEDLPNEVRVSLRRKLAALLEESGRGWFSRNDAHLGAASDELRSLLRDDPDHANEYRARLALIHIARQRSDLARPLLEKVEVRRLSDVRMLERLIRAYTDLDDGVHVLRCLERLTIVAASDRGHWEDWIVALTSTGEEHKLRSAIRRLLRGVPRMKLSRDTEIDLKDHLRDSYWRSIGRQVALRTEAGHLEALALLDEVERLSAAEDLPLWISWSRAFVFNALERAHARDAAIGELDRILAERRKAAREELEHDAEPDAELDLTEMLAALDRRLDRIAFPDGLAASWSSARELLTREAPVPPAGGTPSDRRGPEGRLGVRWVFETDGQAAVTAIKPLDAQRLLVADTDGDLYGLDRRSGKVLWAHTGVFETRPGTNPQTQAYAPMQVPVLGPAGSFFVPGSGRVLCFGPDGARRWEAQIGDGSAALALAAGPEGLFVHDPGSGEVASLDLADGKVRWHRTLEMSSRSAPVAQGSGLSLEGGRLLVFGPRTAILGASDGRVHWTFDPESARRVPITLEEPDGRYRGLFGRRSRRPRMAAAGGAAARPGSAPLPGAPFGSVPPTVFLGGRSRPAIGIGGGSWSGPVPPGWSGGPPAAYYGPGAVAPTVTTFLTPGGRSPQTWSPKNPGRATAVVAPAARWAAPLPYGASRTGLLFGHRLLLLRAAPPAGANPTNVEALVVDLDLPLFGSEVRVTGTPLGRIGSRLVLLQGGRVVLWDVERGTQSAYDLERVSAGFQRYQVHAAREGAFLYASGPGGVLCLNLNTLKEVFHASWPDSVRPLRNDEPTWVQYLLHGMTEFRQGSAMTPVLRPSGHADEDTLYTVSDPYRVVALEDRTSEGAAADEEDAGGR